VRSSLTAVESASRSAMQDLRRLLDLLHGQNTGSAQRQPGLDNLDELLEGVGAAGLPARLTTHGDPRELPGSLDVALYRIVQEALTNAAKYAAGRPATVRVDYGADVLEIAVTTEGPATGPGVLGSGGRGLAGLRDRVGALGGRFTAGPSADGFRVSAQIPTAEIPLRSNG